MAIFTIDDISDSTEARFWAKVDKRGRDDCWPWTASRQARGYGNFMLATKTPAKATHVSLVLAGEPRPSDRHGALHTCDNPPCCNPNHLFWGTQTVNNADAASKGRSRARRGEDASKARLTTDQVLEIRASPLGIYRVAKKYGISTSHANNIRKRRIWRHI